VEVPGQRRSDHPPTSAGTAAATPRALGEDNTEVTDSRSGSSDATAVLESSGGMAVGSNARGAEPISQSGSRAGSRSGSHAGSQAPSRPSSASHTGASRAQSNFATGAARTATTTAEALDRGELPRMRAFGWFGLGASVASILVTLLVGGDPTLRMIYWIGASILIVCCGALAWLTTSEARYAKAPLPVLWVAATLGMMSATPYFGPFSAAAVAPLLVVIFVSLGRSTLVAWIVTALVLLLHLSVAMPIVAGKLADRGIFNGVNASAGQLMAAEALLLGFYIGAFALGRYIRSSTSEAMAELQKAMRLIGDQQAALAEVQADAKRQASGNAEGRWTGQTLGSYKLGLVLGRGAMGEVYEAKSTSGENAAVKLLTARSTQNLGLLQRFQREMGVAAQLSSPHIVQVYAVAGPEAAMPYIAMERLYGQDLSTRLRSVSRLSFDELTVMVDHVARGLEVARVQGVVHRDLKPHNLFKAEYNDHPPVWKILDFGVSKVTGSEGTLTGEGIVGTPQYMAPEQASGAEVTHLADVYALAAIVYRCLTGRPPFADGELAELVYKVVHVAPVRPSTLGRVPEAVENVLAVGMAKDPRRRFTSAAQFARAFISARRGRQLELDVPTGAWE
jgi:serine/threonine-protein kinase